VKEVTIDSRTATGWQALLWAAEVGPKEDLIRISIVENFASGVPASKMSKLRVVGSTASKTEDLHACVEKAGLLPLVVCAAVAFQDDRALVTEATNFLNIFFPKGMF